MKKLFALMLALCLMCSVAMAETATEINWADVEAAAAEINGVFIPIDLGLQVWAPADYLIMTDLSEEYTNLGITTLIANEDLSGAIALQYVEANGASVEECVANIPGAEDAEPVVINGLECINFDMPSMDATSVAFATEKGNLYVISFMPMSNTDFAAKATIMMASLSLAE